MIFLFLHFFPSPHPSTYTMVSILFFLSQENRKSRNCGEWKRGHCERGDQCKFKHDPRDHPLFSVCDTCCSVLWGGHAGGANNPGENDGLLFLFVVCCLLFFKPFFPPFPLFPILQEYVRKNGKEPESLVHFQLFDGVV